MSKYVLTFFLVALNSTATSFTTPTPPRGPGTVAKDSKFKKRDSMVGYSGFDPLNLGIDKNVEFFRDAEVKHGRIAMLAALGLPTAELVHGRLAEALDLPSLLVDGKFPSLVNGGLSQTPIPYFLLANVAGSAMFELMNVTKWDPLNLSSPDQLKQAQWELAELKNGRLAMMAVPLYVIQELITGKSLF